MSCKYHLILEMSHYTTIYVYTFRIIDDYINFCVS